HRRHAGVVPPLHGAPVPHVLRLRGLHHRRDRLLVPGLDARSPGDVLRHHRTLPHGRGDPRRPPGAMSPSPDRRLRIMLLFGGQSAEHDVSRVSAVAVARALDPDRYDVVPVAITREGRWLLADRARAALETGQWPSAFEIDGAPVRIAERRAGLGAAVVRLESGSHPLGAVDVAFPLLHGPYGEDGTVQGLLELAGLPYVGSGVLGSAVGMDKVMMKRAFAACGLATPRSVAFREDGVTKADLDRGEELLGYPCFVKP